MSVSNRFKPTLNIAAEEVKREEQRQENLHNKYKDVPKETKIVENSAIKSTAKVMKGVIATIIEILVFALAFVGVMALVFPESRAALIEIFQNFLTEAQALIS